jgi:hypothetical protein
MPTGFGAVEFGILVASTGARRIDADVTEIKIPGGPTYVDIGGPRAIHISLELFFATGSVYASLEALVGTQATLTTEIGAIANACLVSLARTWYNAGGTGPTKAAAEFVIPSA